MTKRRVVIGLSGGVDSSVAAAILLAGGYEVHGVYLECYNEPGCRTDQDKADALKVAIKLGIGFEVLDFRKEYREKVIEYFYSEYKQGRTPNPDVMCNREIKFGIFYDWALGLNAFAFDHRPEPFDFVATGHYARIVDGKLARAIDETKDQSYFLWQIPQDHFKNIIFPLGNMYKADVRKKAAELKLLTASKPDSMGICFIGEVNVSKLLKDKLGEQVGPVIFKDMVIGEHKGLWFHTIGERGGFTVDKLKLKKMGMHPEKMEPLYVTAKNKARNELIVGYRDETLKRVFRIDNIDIKSNGSRNLFVRIRNLGEMNEVVAVESGKVETKELIFGIAEGQSAVFYDDNGILVGGAIIV